MHTKNKAVAQKIHAGRRAAERFDLNLTEEKYIELHNLIISVRIGFISKQCFLAKRQSIRVYVYAVQMDEKWMPVVYDNKRKTIVSFLPMEFFTQNNVILPRINL